MNCTSEKICRYDDVFKAKARAHQFTFREEVLQDFYTEKNPQVILSPESAKRGLIFCEVYRDLINQKVKTFGISALFSNMLRSEHIPYNLFVPMEDDLIHAKDLFNKIIGGGIARINRIEIEYPGKKVAPFLYLKDRTSFDTFIEYECENGNLGGIGIEVKYTENGYPLGVKERNDIIDGEGMYRQMTRKSGYYDENMDVMMFLGAHHLRQIWRNHLLGYAMVDHEDIQRFHHIHLYPQGNVHFHTYAVPEYEKLLTVKGRNSFIALTFENLFGLLSKYFTSFKQQEWIRYLYRRYIVAK